MDGLASRDGRGESRLDRMRAAMRQNLLSVGAGQERFPVLHLSPSGFSVDAARAAHLRGLVGLYHGRRQIAECLIVHAGEDQGLVRYEFKRITDAETGPARDYAPGED